MALTRTCSCVSSASLSSCSLPLPSYPALSFCQWIRLGSKARNLVIYCPDLVGESAQTHPFFSTYLWKLTRSTASQIMRRDDMPHMSQLSIYLLVSPTTGTVFVVYGSLANKIHSLVAVSYPPRIKALYRHAPTVSHLSASCCFGTSSYSPYHERTPGDVRRKRATALDQLRPWWRPEYLDLQRYNSASHHLTLTYFLPLIYARRV